MKSFLRNTRITPKKAGLIAVLIRGKKVADALDILKFTPKKGAKIMYKAIKSAASNAEKNFNQDINNLIVSKIIVNKGITYKRGIHVSRGRVHPLWKRNSNIWVEVQSSSEQRRAEGESQAKGGKNGKVEKSELKPKAATKKAEKKQKLEKVVTKPKAVQKKTDIKSKDVNKKLEKKQKADIDTDKKVSSKESTK
jgi:large subunit ribosomal protein L22